MEDVDFTQGLTLNPPPVTSQATGLVGRALSGHPASPYIQEETEARPGAKTLKVHLRVVVELELEARAPISYSVAHQTWSGSWGLALGNKPVL